MFVILQVADLILPALTDATWPYRALVLASLAGAPVSAVLAWLYDRTDRGIERAAATPPRFRGSATISIVAMVAIVGAALVWFSLKRVRAAGLDASLIAVLPFRVNGAAPDLAYLHEGAVDLLATKMSRMTDTKVVDPQTAMKMWSRLLSRGGNGDRADAVRVARRLRAARVLTGEVIGQNDNLTINAHLVDAATGRPAVNATATGSAADLPGLFDELTASLLALDAGEDETRLAELTSVSSSALREYLSGRSAYRRGHFNEALRHFGTAINTDSTFALAALGGLRAREWSASFPGWSTARAAAIAWRARDRMGPLEKSILHSIVGPRYPEIPNEAELCEGWKQALAIAPDNAELTHNVADCHYHFGPVFNTPNYLDLARVGFEKSLEFDSTYAPSLQHLVEIAARTGDSTAARRWGTLYLQGDTLQDARSAVQWWMTYATRDTTRINAALPGMLATTQQRIVDFHETLGLDAQIGMMSDSALMNRARRSARLLFRMAERRGDEARLNTLMRDSAGRAPYLLDYAAIAEALYGEADTAAARFVVQALERSVPPDTMAGARIVRSCILAQWRLWRGEDARAFVQEINQLSNDRQPQVRNAARGCAIVIEAIAAVKDRRPDAMQKAQRVDSLARVGGARLAALTGYYPVIAARVLEAAGDPRAALIAVRRRQELLTITPLLSSSLREEGRLAAATGDRAGAIEAYRHYIALRPHPQGRSIELTQHVQRELQRLAAER